ncbi:PqiC family protein [Pararhodospirillum photometricum]|uniref:ABC-type transport auxiliary lipoprotein component domain-containing protein n=1 Tax=Pararhodospirillum photometricum DSM 122 TaxID=1150469 RepID=H6SL23_PARPM|nr:PqiC family protein [Pararhodospirillum photometricum]CCG08688.1 Putative uncharacterized protein [Pararhodospirillum photometricum DSM 122]
MRRGRGRALVLALALASLCGCTRQPAPRLFILAPATLGPASVISAQNGAPLVSLMPVRVPDYLDSTDILRRTGPNELTPSPDGRWGERLSSGLTDALASALLPHLPGQVLTTQPAPQAARRLSLVIETLEIGRDSCWVIAQWEDRRLGSRETTRRGRGVFVESTGAQSDDSAVAAALGLIIERLARSMVETESPDIRDP